MPRVNRWSDLTIGLLAFAGIAVVVLGVLIFARVGALHGDQLPLYLVTNDASGVLKGTEVWLGGRQVGIVKDVRFRDATVDTAERVLVEMSVLTQYVNQIRRNSNVRIGPGGNLLGARVVAVTVGTANSPRVVAGDTLRALTLSDGREQSTATVTALGDSIVAVAATLGELQTEIHETGTDVDKLRRGSEAQITAVGRAIDQFTRRATRSRGTIALAIRDTAFHSAVARFSAQTDSIRTLVTSGKGSIGRFRRDSTLVNEMERVRTSITTLRTRLMTGGNLSRADSALPKQLDQMHLQLDSLIADAKANPIKYLPL